MTAEKNAETQAPEADTTDEQNPVEQFDTSPEAEMEALKNQAQIMGLRVSPKIGLDALRKKIRDALENQNEKEEIGTTPEDLAGLSKQERFMKIREKLTKEQMRLVRVRITCHNPDKANMTGEIFTFANKYLGNVRKFIPYGEATDDGYHIPYCIYQELKNRKYLQKKVRRRGGREEITTRFVPEFGIEELPPLTEKELRELATQQRAAQGIEA